jgi:hypothetical protein
MLADVLPASDINWVETVLGATPPQTRTGDLALNNAAQLGASVVIAKGCVLGGDAGPRQS